jgi:hypothetical protein
MPDATAVLYFFEVAEARDAAIHTFSIVADAPKCFRPHLAGEVA